MSSESTINPKDSAEEEHLKPDPVELKQATEVLLFWGKTFSLMKVFPPENPSVKNAFVSFGQKIKEFLDHHKELKIGIDEFSFSYKGETIFSAEEKKKSLPFLFFKDGMRELTFHKELDSEEIQDFLEIIQKDSDLPPEESDIINSLWEADFPHIRYIALDEFLDSDIGDASNESVLNIDRSKFSSGLIELSQEDKTDIQNRKHALRLPSDESKDSDDQKKIATGSTPFSHLATLGEIDIPQIESMLCSDREGSRLAELVTLLFEILFLEDRQNQFSNTLNILEKCHHEVLNKADFSQAVFLLSHIIELKKTVSDHSKEKERLLGMFIDQAKEESSLVTLKNLFFEKRVKDSDSFFQYLKLLSPKSIPLVAEIWDESKDHLLRHQASKVLEEEGTKNVNILLSIAQDQRFSLIKKVISVLGKMGDEKVIPHLEIFANRQEKVIRIEAIQALNNFDDESARNILLKLLFDEDGEVRTLAANNLKYFGNIPALDTVMEIIQKKDFKKKSSMEKKALLHLLARTESAEVYPFFRSILQKRNILSWSKQNETRFAAVSALETMVTPEAADILKEGTRLRKKSLRQACHIALKKITARNEFSRIIEGEHRV